MESYEPSLYINKYLDYLKFERKLSENTLKSYLNDLKGFDLYFKGNILALKYKDISDYLNSLNDLNARSVAHYITVINSLSVITSHILFHHPLQIYYLYYKDLFFRCKALLNYYFI